MSHNNLPTPLETHYANIGFSARPAVHIGSQSSALYKNDHLEQSVEGLHIAASLQGDLVVVRNVDPEYISYWNNLVGKTHVINITTDDRSTFLSQYILSSPDILSEIKNNMHPQSKLMVYFPTELEEKLARQLNIKIHGSTKTGRYGTKSGIRNLSKKAGLIMAEGYICKNEKQIQVAVQQLFTHYECIIIKHDISSAGRWMIKLTKSDSHDIPALLQKALNRKYDEESDIFVVEGWIESSASLCAHIEIVEGHKPVIASAWQQIIGKDGVTYEGAGPHRLTKKSHESFMKEVHKLAYALYEEGAIGSFGPDYVIAQDDKNFEDETTVLIELNARVPFTAFPLEIAKFVKGTIGTGFFSHKVTLQKPLSFHEVKKILEDQNLLISKPDRYANGVVPFNINLLEWNELYYVALADDWEKTQIIAKKMKKLFT